MGGAPACTAALCVRIQTYFEKTKIGDKSKGVANTLKPTPKIYEKSSQKKKIHGRYLWILDLRGNASCGRLNLLRKLSARLSKKR